MDAVRATALTAAAVAVAFGSAWAYKSAGDPGSSELFLTASKTSVRVGEPVELRLELYTAGRVPVRRDLPSNFGVRIGSAEIGAVPVSLASGLSLGVNSKEARVAADEKISVVIKGTFRPGKRGGLAFVAEGREPVPIGPPGPHEIRAAFSPFTEDPATLYRGESFSKPVLMTVGK